LLVSGPVAQEKQAIWMISIIGTSLKKLRDDGHDAALSPDGTQIAFENVDNDAVWLMNADGSQARQLFKADPEFHVYGPTWMAGGKRIAYVKVATLNGKSVVVLESRNLKAEDIVPLLDNPDAIDETLNQPGRLIYSVLEPSPRQQESNLWQLYYDQETGRPKSAPQRLTDWSGFTFLNPGISADGKHFVFLNEKDQSAVYVGELASGGDELKSPQRLTLNEKFSWPSGWSSDAQSVLFYSNRSGTFDVYKQSVTDRRAEPIASAAEEKWAPQTSPDGKWILYMQWNKPQGDVPVTKGNLMRVPVTGGTPETVMEINGKRPGLQAAAINTVGGYPSFRCGRRPEASCIVAERRDKENVFTSFDPIQGRKSEIAKVSREGRGSSWDLSPDGAQIALSEYSYTEGVMQIIPTDGKPRQKFSVTPWQQVDAVAWSADGKSLFFGSYSSRGTSIVRTDLAGHARMLYKAGFDIFAISPSPDGKWLAFGPVITDANAWTLGSFPEK
jgi:Tol biopolymer transport system component